MVGHVRALWLNGAISTNCRTLTAVKCIQIPLTLYSAEAIIVPHRMILVGTLAVNGWAVTFGTARRGLGGAAARPGPSLLYQM